MINFSVLVELCIWNAVTDWLHTFLCPDCFCLALVIVVITNAFNYVFLTRNHRYIYCIIPINNNNIVINRNSSQVIDIAQSIFKQLNSLGDMYVQDTKFIPS